MTVKKCDACSKVYEKGYIFAYSLDSYEVNKANTQTKYEDEPVIIETVED